MILLKSIFVTFTIWVLTALLNAVLAGTWLSFFSTDADSWPGTHFLVFIFSLIFSIPGIFIFWILLLVGWNEDNLFRVLLKAGFIISVLSSLLLYFIDERMVKNNQIFLAICIVVSSVTAIMMHHPIIKFLHKKNHNNV